MDKDSAVRRVSSERTSAVDRNSSTPMALFTPPASPPLDVTLFEEIASETPRIRLRPSSSSSSSSATSPEDVELEFDDDLEDQDMDSMSLSSSDESTNSAPFNERAVLLNLLNPIEEEVELQTIHSETLNEVIPSDETRDDASDNSSLRDALEHNPFLSDSDTEHSCSESDSGVSDLGHASEMRGGAATGRERGERREEEDKEAQYYLKELYLDCIKEELKHKIRLKRFRSGQEEVQLEHRLPVTTISFEAIKKRNEVRERNRVYAQLSRNRATVREVKLEKEYIRLLKRNQELKGVVNRLHSHLRKLKHGFADHASTCRLKSDPLSPETFHWSNKCPEPVRKLKQRHKGALDNLHKSAWHTGMLRTDLNNAATIASAVRFNRLCLLV